MDTFGIVVLTVCWLVLLVWGIRLMRDKRDGQLMLMGIVIHFTSIACLFYLLGTAEQAVGFGYKQVGWWFMAALPAAVMINLALIWLAGKKWPHCTSCGGGMRYMVEEDEDFGYLRYLVCRKCGEVRKYRTDTYGCVG